MIPTAEEYALEYMQETDLQEIESALIGFTKLHVEAALKSAAENHQPKLYIKGTWKGAKWKELKDGESYDPTINSVMTKTNKKSIRDSYPSENIK